MKLARIGEIGKEKPVVIDRDGNKHELEGDSNSRKNKKRKYKKFTYIR